jgi:hypothetical protein
MRISFFLLSFLVFGIRAGAQTEKGSEARVNLREFQVHQVSHVNYGGIPYTRIDYRYHFNRDQEGVRAEPLLLALNGMAIPASLYETFSWKTKKGAPRPSWLPPDDKMKHLFAGFFIGDATNLALQLLIPENTPHRRLIATLSGFGMAAVTGVVKELRDRQGYGTPDPKDALATAVGGALGTISMSFDVRKVLHPKEVFRQKKKASTGFKF